MLSEGVDRLRGALEESIRNGGPRRAGVQSRRLGNGHRPVIAVPLADSEEIVRCIGDVVSRDLAHFLLIGAEGATRRVAAACRVPLEGVRFLPADDELGACEVAAGAAATGEAQIVMKGNVHTSGFIRALLAREKRLLAHGALLSHVAVLDVPAYHKLVLISDAAINVEPTVEEKIVILANAVSTARSLGVRRPKIACVAPVEVPSPQIRSTLDADKIRRRWAAGRLLPVLGDVEVGGPFGLDVAISPEAASMKGIRDSVAGDADILLMPNLDSGNSLYKSLTNFAGARVAGIVAGARAPVVLTSRSDSEENRFYSVLLALAQVDVRVFALRSDRTELTHKRLASRP